MTIGKRKGYAAKGVGAEPTAGVNKGYGGSLSRNDHNYITRAFGMSGDPGAGSFEQTEASGGIINEYSSGPLVYRSHTFNTSGSFVVSKVTDDPAIDLELDVFCLLYTSDAADE